MPQSLVGQAQPGMCFQSIRRFLIVWARHGVGVGTPNSCAVQGLTVFSFIFSWAEGKDSSQNFLKELNPTGFDFDNPVKKNLSRWRHQGSGTE